MLIARDVDSGRTRGEGEKARVKTVKERRGIEAAIGLARSFPSGSKWKMNGPDSLYQLKVSLRGTHPPVWRRLLVRGDTTLFRLHAILQVAMGWTDSHLHQFFAEGMRFGVADLEIDPDVKSDRRVAVFQVAPHAGSRLVYEYDFGDEWTHEVRVERILDRDDGVATPTCLDGRMACPPEDCGGVHGYTRLLDAIVNPADPRHEELTEWLGRPFDPTAFDRDALNKVLARRRPRSRPG